MKKNILFWLLFFLCVPAPGFACDQAIKTPFQALSLFNDEYWPWLETTWAGALCPNDDGACFKTLPAATETVPLREKPDGDPVAYLAVIYAPGQSITAQLLHQGRTYPYVPPLYDGDWGYGPPWFHATLLETRGEWHKIAVPVLGSAWIRRPQADIYTPDRETVHQLGSRHIMILDQDAQALTVRDEQSADMWCEPGDPPPIKPSPRERLEIGAFYDEHCELRLVPAYTRGC